MQVNTQVVQEWISWEHLILQDLKAIERKIQRFYKATTFFPGKREIKEQFVAHKLRELVAQSIGEGQR